MPNPIQILRSAVTGNRPPAGKLPGEPYVNWADKAFGVVDAAGATQDLIAVRHWSAEAAYVPGANVLYRSQIYACSVATGPGPFRYPDWKTITRREAEWGSLSVETTGDDALGDGSAAAPWATLQRAFDHISNDLDIGIAGLTINIGVGVFVGPKIWNPYGGSPSGGYIRIVGAGVDQTIIIENNALACFYVEDATVDLSVTAVTLRVGVASAVFADRSMISLVGPMAIETSQVGGGGVIAMVTETALFASGAIELRQTGAATPNTGSFDIKSHSHFVDGAQWTLSGTPNTYSAWVELDEHSYYSGSATFTGACVGKRYQGTHGAIFNSGGRGVDLLPGDQPGTLDASSFYDGVQGGSTYDQPHGDGSYFVDAAGDDTTGDGLSVATAWATIRKAFDHLALYPGVNGVVVINVGAGAFGWTSVSWPSMLAGTGYVRISGAGAALTTWDGGSFYGTRGGAVPKLHINHITLNEIVATYGADVTLGQWDGLANDVVIDTATMVGTDAPLIATYGSILATSTTSTGTIELRQGGRSYASVISLKRGSQYIEGGSWTLTGATPDTCSTGFISADSDSSYIASGVNLLRDDEGRVIGEGEPSPLIFAGPQTIGPKFALTNQSWVATGGAQGAAAVKPGGLDYFPGTLPGVSDASSSYDGVQGGTTYDDPLGNATFYVEVTGSNTTGDGSQAAPWASLRAAYDHLALYREISGIVTINLGPGDHAYASLFWPGLTGNGIVDILGAGSASSSVDGIFIHGPDSGPTPTIYVNKLTIKSTIPSSDQVNVANGGTVCLGDRMGLLNDVVIDNAIGLTHSPIQAYARGFISTTMATGGMIELRQYGCTYPAVIELSSGGRYEERANWTLTGTPDTCAQGFLTATGDSNYVAYELAPILKGDERVVEDDAATPLIFTGLINGPKFKLSDQSSVQTNGKQGAAAAPPGGLDFFPGTLPGTMDSSSSYDGVIGGAGRILLTAPLALTVDAAGSDTAGDGSATAPWATLAKVADHVRTRLDLNFQTVTVRIGAGTFAGADFYAKDGTVKLVGAGKDITFVNTSMKAYGFFTFMASNMTVMIVATNAFRAEDGCTLILDGGIALDASVSTYDPICIRYFSAGVIRSDIELRQTGVAFTGGFISVGPYSTLSDQAQWTLTGTPNTYSSWLALYDHSVGLLLYSTYTGTPSASAAYSLRTMSYLDTKGMVLPGDLPTSTCDNSSFVDGVQGNHREVLTANREYFIETTGSDANTGSQMVSGKPGDTDRDEITGRAYGPWATLRKAFDYIEKDIDLNGFIITLNLGAGVFQGSWCNALTGKGTVYVKGAGAALTTIGDAATGSCFQVNGDGSEARTAICINRVTLIPGATYYAVYVQSGGYARFRDPFGGDPLDIVISSINSPYYLIFVTGLHSLFTTGGGPVTVQQNGVSIYTVFQIQYGGEVDDSATWTFIGTPDVLMTAFNVVANRGSFMSRNSSYVGTFTGQRFSVTEWSGAKGYAALPLDFFPGTLPGTWDASSLYGGVQGGQRRVLTANEVYYVDVAGSDTANDGMSAAAPWATLQKARDVVCDTLDINGKEVAISIGAGSFVGVNLWNTVGEGKIYIVGAGSALTTITPIVGSVGWPYTSCIACGAPKTGRVSIYLNGVTLDQSTSNEYVITVRGARELYIRGPNWAESDLVFIPNASQSWALVNVENSTFSILAGAVEICAATTAISAIIEAWNATVSDDATYTLTGAVLLTDTVVGKKRSTFTRSSGSVVGDVTGIAKQFALTNYSSIVFNNSTTYPGVAVGTGDPSCMIQGVMGTAAFDQAASDADYQRELDERMREAGLSAVAAPPPVAPPPRTPPRTPTRR